MTALDAAAEVLRRAGTPLHVNRITELMLDSDFWTTEGKTPWATVNARIVTDINRKGDQSRFYRDKPGFYGLNADRMPTPGAKPVTPAREAQEAKWTFADAAERVLRQNDGQQPLHYREITRRIMDLGLVETEAAIPAYTLNAGIGHEIQRRQEANEPQRFVRLGRGLIGLASVEPGVIQQATNAASGKSDGELEPGPPKPLNRAPMTALDAAAAVLRDAGKPLHIKSITDRMIDRGLWKSNGKTPWATVSARIGSDLAREDGQSRFRRVKLGVYGLNENSARTESPIQNEPTPDATETILSLADAAEEVFRMDGSQEPLHYQEIARRASKLGLVATKAEIPAAALNSSISSDILRRGKANRPQRFLRHGGGLIGPASTAQIPKVSEGLGSDSEVTREQPTTRHRVLMTAVDAAAEVLRRAGKPLHIKCITNRILELRLWKTSGKTPWWTVNSRIGSEITIQGERSRFHRVRPAVYELSAPFSAAPEPEPDSPTHEAVSKRLSYTDAAERTLRQNEGQEPLHYREIARRMLDLKLIETKAVLPAHTLNVQVCDEIRTRKKAKQPQRFVRVGNGLIDLVDAKPEGIRRAIDEENRRVRDELLNFVSSTDLIVFEHLVCELFSAMGAESVKVTRRGGDGGVDVRGTLLVGGAIPIKMAGQVKRWKKRVSSRVVNETRGSLGLHDVGLVVTTGRFNHEARQAAQIEDRKPITLIDGDALVDLLAEHEIWVKRQQHDLLTLATPDPDRTKISR